MNIISKVSHVYFDWLCEDYISSERYTTWWTFGVWLKTCNLPNVLISLCTLCLCRARRCCWESHDPETSQWLQTAGPLALTLILGLLQWPIGDVSGQDGPSPVQVLQELLTRYGDNTSISVPQLRALLVRLTESRVKTMMHKHSPPKPMHLRWVRKVTEDLTACRTWNAFTHV